MDLTEEELKDALKILKKPVKVGNKLYKYFDEENYDILEEVYLKCLDVYNHIDTLLVMAKEHKMMKDFILENNLWEKFVNDEKFLDWTAEDKKEDGK